MLMEAANIWYKKCERAIGQQARLSGNSLPLRRVRSGMTRMADLGPPISGKPHDPDWEKEHFYARHTARNGETVPSSTK
ncbi:hypothetical protein X746_28695 [Mesorhizobium sp. LNJC380A00]|nr:hypothetical protein X746_28695 [Mesorhizobium sp. LNJC380A00]